MASPIVIVVGILIGMVVVPAVAWFVIWYNSFKFKVWIAIQSGEDTTDVIWMEDRFKVVNKEGRNTIIFRFQKDKSQSFGYKQWTKVLNKKIDFDESAWRGLKKHLRRGLFLYKTTEGEYHPMEPTILEKDKRGFRVLPSDNRGFLIDQFQHINNLTLTSRKQIIALAMIIVGIVILSICFVLFLVYLTEASQNICGVAGNTVLKTAQGVVGG